LKIGAKPGIVQASSLESGLHFRKLDY